MEPKFYSPIQKFLDQIIFANHYLYFDYWSLVHFSAGMLLGWLLYLLPIKHNKFILAFFIIVVYEILELGLNDLLFIPETPLDTFWDLIVGPAGFLLIYLIVQKKKIKNS